MSKIAHMGLGCFFPTNQDLADILGRTDFHSEDIFGGRGVGGLFWIPDFQIQGCQLACLV